LSVHLLGPNIGQFFPSRPRKVRKHRGHEVAVMRVGRWETGSIQIQNVTRLVPASTDVGGTLRHRQPAFEFVLKVTS
jgi:hypothetical protein